MGMIEVCKTAMFSIMVHRVDIIRLRSGPDHLYLQTNLPNPVYPYSGTLAIRLATTRGSGREWIKRNLNDSVEITEADLETIVAERENSAPVASSSPLLPDVTVAPVERGAAPQRPVLSLRRYR